MQALDVEEMEASSKKHLQDVLWWMSIKNVCKPWALVITKLSKEGCIYLVVGGRSPRIAHKHD
jgi:hypothetical protein